MLMRQLRLKNYMNQDFTELAQYLDEKFNEVNNKVDNLTSDIHTLQQSVDDISKDKQTKTQEMAVLNHRMKKAEDWIDDASPKIGLKFEH